MAKRRSQGEGTLYFDQKRERWVGQAWVNGRRRKVSAPTKIEATSKLGALLHGDDADREADRKITVGALLEDWLTKALPHRTGRGGRPLSPSARQIRLWSCELLTGELGAVKVHALTVDDVERALGRLVANRRLSRSSITKVLGTLRLALDWAVKRRVATWNPAQHAELPTELPETDPRRALSRAALGRLLAVDHPLVDMWRCSGQLGLRPGEASGLCVDAINFDAGTLSVVRAVQLHRGRPVLVEALKTSGARRTLEMPSSLAGALRHHIDAIGGDGLLWSAPDGGPLWPTTVRNELRRACAEAGIDPPVRPNELRHTYATLMADSGVPPHVLADVLGHNSTRMVDAHYRHRPEVRTTGVGLEL